MDIIITVSLFFLLDGSRTGTDRYGSGTVLSSYKSSSACPHYRLNAVIDSLIRYAFETGFLTWYAIRFYDKCLVLLIASSAREHSLLCSVCVVHTIFSRLNIHYDPQWLILSRNNLVFMGLHFVISKCLLMLAIICALQLTSPTNSIRELSSGNVS